MAYHYSKFGAEIVLTARRETLLRKVMEKCLQLGAKKVFYIPDDMSSPQAPERVVQFALQKLGGLDHLVLNHIGSTPFRMWEGDVEHTRWLLQVNFLSYVALASAALPILAESKGSLIVVSSLTGKVSTPFTTSYSATKFALDGFFGSLRHELAMQKQDVCITLCILGLINTEVALEKTRFDLPSLAPWSQMKEFARHGEIPCYWPLSLLPAPLQLQAAPPTASSDRLPASPSPTAATSLGTAAATGPAASSSKVAELPDAGWLLLTPALLQLSSWPGGSLIQEHQDHGCCWTRELCFWEVQPVVCLPCAVIV
ncbi:hydroxysteroid 11-beta-dehydrogenase 1-like protein isoform X2 [Pelodiscus sinensis]